VLLADDYPPLLVALRRLLGRSCEIVGSVSSGRAAIAAVESVKPDVVVLDLTMPDVSGVDVCREIKRGAPQTDVIVLTAADDPTLRDTVTAAGASGFIAKHSVLLELDRTIQAIWGGRER
jgi:DNA-binding NarL/FixJ family response regulator